MPDIPSPVPIAEDNNLIKGSFESKSATELSVKGEFILDNVCCNVLYIFLGPMTLTWGVAITRRQSLCSVA